MSAPPSRRSRESEAAMPWSPMPRAPTLCGAISPSAPSRRTRPAAAFRARSAFRTPTARSPRSSRRRSKAQTSSKPASCIRRRIHSSPGRTELRASRWISASANRPVWAKRGTWPTTPTRISPCAMDFRRSCAAGRGLRCRSRRCIPTSPPKARGFSTRIRPKWTRFSRRIPNLPPRRTATPPRPWILRTWTNPTGRISARSCRSASRSTRSSRPSRSQIPSTWTIRRCATPTRPS